MSCEMDEGETEAFPEGEGEGRSKQAWSGVFKVGWSYQDVLLDSTHLHWDQVNGNEKNTYRNVIAISDILAVKTDETNWLGQPISSVCVHHVTRHENHAWTVSRTSFLAVDEATRGHWAERLQHSLSDAVSGSQRPASLLVFVNPYSGGMKGQSIFQQYAAPLLELAGIRTQVVLTEHRGHIVEYLQNCSLEGIDGIITVGGDGTMSEAVQGVLQQWMREAGKDIHDPEAELEFCPLRIGIIPAGSSQAMVYAATGIHDPTTAVLHIIMGNSEMMGVTSVFNSGKLIGYSTLVAAYGFIAEMLKRSDELRMFGRLRYLITLWTASRSLVQFYDFDVHYNPSDDNTVEHTEDDISPGGWRLASGPFVGIVQSPWINATMHHNLGWAELVMLTQPVNQGITKTIRKVFRFQENAFECDVVKKTNVKAFKTINRSPAPGEEVPPSSRSSTTEAITASKPAQTWLVNIDGENFNITNPSTLYRINTSNYRLFGTFPFLRPQN